jgi:hypothetical protein
MIERVGNLQSIKMHGRSQNILPSGSETNQCGGIHHLGLKPRLAKSH